MVTHLSSPVDKPFTVPLDILLVVWRYMLLDGAVLIESSIQSGVGTDAVSSIEYLYRGSGKPGIHLLLDVFKRNG